jgi:glycosyltransferase involved in cell wall biosynthesis
VSQASPSDTSQSLRNFTLLIIAATEGQDSPHLRKLLPSLRDMQVPFVFAGWDRRSALPDSFEQDGIRQHMIFRGWGYGNRGLLIGLPLWVGRAFLFLLAQRPRMVMAIDFDTGLPMALAALVTRVPFVYNIRDNFAMRAAIPAWLRPAIRTLDRWVIHRATKVIVPDESLITETNPALRDKFIVVHNCALDIAPPDAQSEHFTLYAMGYLRKSRGIGLVLDAAERLPHIHVRIAGVVDESDLLDRIQQLPNVTFHGRLSVEQALELCFVSDVIVTFYAPDSEINRRAISNKWSDAMMASKPILVNSEVYKSAWIVQEDIGYVVPYGDVEQLVAMLEHIRLHPDEARRKGANGRRLYDAGYSWAAMERRIHQLLMELEHDTRPR